MLKKRLKLVTWKDKRKKIAFKRKLQTSDKLYNKSDQSHRLYVKKYLVIAHYSDGHLPPLLESEVFFFIFKHFFNFSSVQL